MITEFSDYEFDQSKTPYFPATTLFQVYFQSTSVEFAGRDGYFSSFSFLTPPTLTSTPTSLLLTYNGFSGNSSEPVSLVLFDEVPGVFAEYRTTWDQFFHAGEPRIVEFPLYGSSGTVTTVSRIDFVGGGVNSPSQGPAILFTADRLTAVTVPEPRGVALGVALLLAFLIVRRLRARAV